MQPEALFLVLTGYVLGLLTACLAARIIVSDKRRRMINGH